MYSLFHKLVGNCLTQFLISIAKLDVLSSKGYRKFMKGMIAASKYANFNVADKQNHW